jgi:FMN-dependent NADH-azoreductase
MWSAVLGMVADKLADNNSQSNQVSNNFSQALAQTQQNSGFDDLDWGLDKLPSQQFGFGNFGGM